MDAIADETDCPSNPFENYPKIGWFSSAQIFAMSIVVAPIKLVFVSVFALLAYFISFATLFNQKSLVSGPFGGFKRRSKNLVARLIIWAHMALGFRFVVKGKRAAPWQAPILVMAPHTSFFDTLPHCLAGAPSVVAKKELVNLPFVRTFLNLTLPIIVDREQKESRRETMEAIKERALNVLHSDKLPENDRWPQVAIFPEGTCTNRSQLISFKSGAFCAQVPVQPICIKWFVSQPDSITWGFEGASILKLFWLSLCKFQHRLEMEYLPVYTPSREELLDAKLYANNIRLLMAKHLNLPVTDYNLEDAPYLSHNCKPNYAKLMAKLNNAIESPSESNLSKDWQLLQRTNLRSLSYQITFEDFILFLKCMPSDQLRRLFNAFDWQCNGRIDMREFILIRNHDESLSLEEYIRLALEMFSPSFSGLRNTPIDLSVDSFVKIVRLPFSLSVKNAKKLYTCIMRQPEGICMDSLLRSLRSIEEYGGQQSLRKSSRYLPESTIPDDQKNEQFEILIEN